MFESLRRWYANIKLSIDELLEEQDIEMEKWEEEDPDAYFEYIAHHQR